MYTNSDTVNRARVIESSAEFLQRGKTTVSSRYSSSKPETGGDLPGQPTAVDQTSMWVT